MDMREITCEISDKINLTQFCSDGQLPWISALHHPGILLLDS